MRPDPQKAALYAMEKDELRGHCHQWMILKGLRSMARDTCKAYKVPHVKIRVYSNGDGGSISGCSIQLDPDCGMNSLTLLHELAHHIAQCRHPKAQDHGPMFCYYYGQLLDAWRLVPIEGFRAACRRYKLKIARAPI